MSWWRIELFPPVRNDLGGMESFAICKADTLAGALAQLPERMLGNVDLAGARSFATRRAAEEGK